MILYKGRVRFSWLGFQKVKDIREVSKIMIRLIVGQASRMALWCLFNATRWRWSLAPRINFTNGTTCYTSPGCQLSVERPFFIPFDPALLGQQLIRLKTVEVSVSPEAVNGNGGTGGGCHHTGTWFKRGGRSWPVSQPAALQQNADHDFHPFFLWRQLEFLGQSSRPFVSKICHSAMGKVCVRVTSY